MVSEMKKANKNVFSASFHRGSLPAIFEQTNKKKNYSSDMDN